MNQKVGYLSSTNRRVKLIKLTSIILAFLALIFSILFSQTVYSEEMPPSCTFGELLTEGDPLELRIKLNCENAVTFANSGVNSADSVDLGGIVLHLASEDINPLAATIDGGLLTLQFPLIEDLVDCRIEIAEGLIFNSSQSLSNALIEIIENDIVDLNPPKATDDYYVIGPDEVLVVSPELGLLFNDFDSEGSVSDCAIAGEPLNGGILELSADGSFTFTQDGTYTGEYLFSYSIKDENGNSAQANVKISTPLPEVEGDFYKIGTGNRVKVGDVLRADFVTSRPVTIITKTINLLEAEVEITDATHFSVYRTMSESLLDIERDVKLFVKVIDEFGREVQFGTEGGFLFDKTKPVIELNDDAAVYLDIGNPYDDPVTVTDNFDHSLSVVVEGSVNSDVVGVYELNYYATDLAGNKSETITRFVHIVDPINDRFDDIYLAQTGLGIITNLGDITSANVDIFSGLYFQNEIDGRLIGRITFDGIVNLNDEELIAFLQNINQYITMDEVGVIGLNFIGQNDNLIFRNMSATIKFFNLDKLGYTKKSKAADIYAKLTVTDELGSPIDKDSIANAPGVYIGCGGNISECYTYTLRIQHFTEYRIGIADIEKNTPHEEVSTVASVTPNNPVVLAANISVRDFTTVDNSTSNTATITQPITNEIVKVDPVNTGRQNNRAVFLGFEWYWWLLFAFMAVIIIWTLLGL